MKISNGELVDKLDAAGYHIFDLLRLVFEGDAKIRPGADSTTGIQFQDSSGSVIASIDTLEDRFKYNGNRILSAGNVVCHSNNVVCHNNSVVYT